MSRKKKRLDGRTLRTKAAYREQARLGKYDELPEFKALCLSKAGYDPQVARPCLTAYPTSPLAGILLQAAQAESKEWHAPLAPLKTEGAEGEGNQPIVVEIAPWASGKSTRRDQLLSAHYLGQRAREGDQEIADAFNHGLIGKPVPQEPEPEPHENNRAPTVEIDRAALIAKLKKPEPEDGGEGDGS